jgi:hypothetical protein
VARFGLGVYDGHLALADHGILDRLAIHAPSVHEHAVPDYCAVHPGLVFSQLGSPPLGFPMYALSQKAAALARCLE